jgi:hypothetical protein
MANKLITQLVIWENYSYSFVFLNLNAPTSITDGIYYWQINYTFGLVSQGVTDPNNIAKKGKRGDYVHLDPSTGALSLMTKATYNYRFPTTKYNEGPIDHTLESKKLQEQPAKYTSPGYNISKGKGSYAQTVTSPTPSTPSTTSTGGTGGY